MRRNGPAVIGRLPDGPGVYRFRDDRGRVLYIGRATGLRSRVGSYWSDLRDRHHLTPMVARVARIEAVSCDSVHEAAWLERNLLETSLPRWNKTPGGQESAVYIRMDTRPAAPGMVAVYRPETADQVRYFGPYLGALRVRQAIAALHRILPLAYTRARLTGAEKDMACTRGVAADDRAQLVGTLTAILNRDPAAVGWARAELEWLRDRAAGELSFEFAAQIQQEIAAVDWVTCTQRVSTMEAVDRTVSGWSDGMLVQFKVSAGRVSGWSQRPCGPLAASRALAATPDDWTDFMARNARLAASLVQPRRSDQQGSPVSPAQTADVQAAAIRSSAG
ncbi:MAG: GIY-YIG nuclease family protein [Streptosporangiaceae bacterium]